MIDPFGGDYNTSSHETPRDPGEEELSPITIAAVIVALAGIVLANVAIMSGWIHG